MVEERYEIWYDDDGRGDNNNKKIIIIIIILIWCVCDWDSSQFPT